MIVLRTNYNAARREVGSLEHESIKILETMVEPCLLDHASQSAPITRFLNNALVLQHIRFHLPT